MSAGEETTRTVPAPLAFNIDVSFERARLDVARIHRWLSEDAYWSRGIPRATVERAIAGSLCAGAFAPQQVGFARVISDGATFAYLCDVFVDADWRGRGVGRRMMEALFAHPSLQGLRRMALVTRDAHALYSRYGFTALADSRRWMERTDADIYGGSQP
jgi:GNAT superfamily N-acetyltransferase